MTYGAFTTQDFASFDKATRSRTPLSQSVLCAVALTLSASLGLWILYGLPVAPPPHVEAPVVAAQALATAPTPHIAAVPPAILPLRRYAAMLDPTFTGMLTPVTFARSAPLRTSFEPLRQRAVVPAAPSINVAALQVAAPAPAAPQVLTQVLPQVTPQVTPQVVADIPLPAPRPAALSLVPVDPSRPSVARRVLPQSVATAAPIAPVDHNTFFNKLFGPAQQATGAVLAYAAPEDGGLGTIDKDRLSRPFPYDRWTAVYDIAAHTVYLPDGTKLEAHSGLGSRLDDPRSVAERMRGVTPPNVYELQLRESLFHGVRALRLNPVGEGTTYGRAGLLAHTYMLGPRGDSNGCVVFKNYKAFLQAYDSGAIKRLAVVARLN